MVDKDEATQEEKTGFATLQVLIDYLDVDKDLANVLVSEGYPSLDLIAAAEASDLNKIEGFDD